MILELIKYSSVITISIVGMYLIFGCIYHLIESKSNLYVTKTFGINGLLLTGIGTVIHELSHYIMCKIFGHRVTDVKLFRPFKFKNDGVLGYVKSSYNKNSLIQRIGNFFIGIAPMIGGTVFIITTSVFLFPQLYNNLTFTLDITQPKSIINMFIDNTDVFYTTMFNINNFSNKNFWIFIYIVISITLHMSLSKADLENAKEGILYIFIASMILTFIFYLLNWDILKIFSYILLYNSIVFSVLLCGLLFSLIGLFITYIIYSIKNLIL